MECGICYTLRLGDDQALPDKVCDEPRCGKPFHRACLSEWLRSNPTTRQSFDTLFGKSRG